MSMRLLPKNEIQEAKATAKRQESDEGLRLAKRIDRLRETYAEEEASLEKFRVRTIAQIHEETTPLIEKADGLRKEIVSLEAKRKELLEPLDKEWAELAEAKKQFNHDLEEANQRTITIEERERAAKKAVKQASDALARAATRDEVSREKHKVAIEAEKKATKALKHAEKVENDALNLSAAMEAELTHRDMEAAARERGVTMKEATLREREAELASGWKLLEDRKALFEKRFTNPKR